MIIPNAPFKVAQFCGKRERVFLTQDASSTDLPYGCGVRPAIFHHRHFSLLRVSLDCFSCGTALAIAYLGAGEKGLRGEEGGSESESEPKGK